MDEIQLRITSESMGGCLRVIPGTWMDRTIPHTSIMLVVREALFAEQEGTAGSRRFCINFNNDWCENWKDSAKIVETAQRILGTKSQVHTQ